MSGSAPAPRVTAVVNLEPETAIGGHVKSWIRFAEATARRPGDLDLTVLFLGDRPRVEHLSPTARIVTVPPVRSTKGSRLTEQKAGHTDLAGDNPAAEPHLRQADVVHITDTFAMSRTALRVTRETGKPLAYSLHTNLPSFTRVYTREIGRRLTGRFGEWVLCDALRLHDVAARVTGRQVVRMMRVADRIWASNDPDRRLAERLIGADRVTMLRRGMNREIFNRKRRDRARLSDLFGLPPTAAVMLFVGRVDATKGALVMADALASLRHRGHDVCGLIVGDGADRPRIAARLGEAVCMPGPLAQEDLGWIYGSCDLFVFPSNSEMSSNVVQEAKTCGLGVFVSAHGTMGQFVQNDGVDGVMVGKHTAEAWADAIEPYLADRERLRALGQAAHDSAMAAVPSWDAVLAEDLLPDWRRLAGHEGANDKVPQRYA